MIKRDLSRIKQDIGAAVDKLAPRLIEVSRFIHAHPELNFQERRAVECLTALLEEKGFQVEKNLAGLSTAFRAWAGCRQAPAVAFLAEYDALPGLGHACGHNLIAASSAGGALALALACPELPGRVAVIGTPAEEGGGGKVLMARAGVFAPYAAAMMVHPDNRTEMVKRTLAMAGLKAVFTGRAAHAAAAPHQGLNALDGVILSFNAIGLLRQQITPDTRIHGIITDGGRAPNIIPERASAAFYVRALEMDYLEELLLRVKDCLYGAARASGTRVEIEEDGLVYAPFKPNYALSGLYRENLESLGVTVDEGSETAGIASTDVGNVSWEVPTIHPSINICREPFAVHSAQFAAAAASDLGRERMLLAAKALAMTGADIIYGAKKALEIACEFNGGE